jgi:glucose/mannose-6-phosphate isomerase
MEKKEIDKFNMHKVITDSPEQLEKGLLLAENIKQEGDFKNIIICGIGGSALPANILNTIAKTKIPIFIQRDYGLSKEANEKSLVICISYSGNTEEALSGLKEALDRNLKIICLSSGGKIEEICKEKNIPFVKIPSGIQPRSATGYIFASLAKVLINSNLIEDISDEIIKASIELKKINKEIEKQGEDLAKKLSGKIPVIYTSNEFKSIGRIWKIKFNENSKIPAFYNYFPELNHNEMVGFSELKKGNNFYFIIIKDDQTNPRNLKRMDLLGEILREKGSNVSFLDIKNGSLTSKVFSILTFGDWTSYYLALEYKIDPTPVKMVEDFKKKLG